MRAAPIPQRIPSLRWRRPSFVWTPIALALAIGWPAVLFHGDPTLLRLALIAGAVVFALALISLGAGWALGRAPRTRRVVVLHVLAAGAVVIVAAPFVLTELLAVVVHHETQAISLEMALAMTPLALVLGLPIVLVSGLVFAVLALTRPPPESELLGDAFGQHDVQPFR
jgi:hypothetical protein